MRRLAAIVCASAAAFGQSAASDTRFDPLLQPAARDVRAADAVLLAVARAGDRLIAVGEAGIVLLSDDAGRSWRQADVPVSTTLTSVRFVSARRGWTVGHGAVVLRTDDGGERWSLQLDGQRAAVIEESAAVSAGTNAARIATARRLVAEGADKPLLDVFFRDENHGWVAGAYGLFFETDDGGRNWRSRMDALPNPKGKHLYRMASSGDEIAVVGEQGAFFRSLDGGRNFSEIASPYAGTFFDVVSLAGGERVVMGLRGNVLRFAAGAWHKVDTGAASTISVGMRLPDGTLLVAEEAGRVLCSADGGRTLRPVYAGDGTPLTGIVDTGGGALVLTGARGVRRLDRFPACKDSTP